MRAKNFTYEKSGVSIKKADNFIKFISSTTKKSKKVVILRILEDLVR